jgi:hypothetical protein
MSQFTLIRTSPSRSSTHVTLRALLRPAEQDTVRRSSVRPPPPGKEPTSETRETTYEILSGSGCDPGMTFRIHVDVPTGGTTALRPLILTLQDCTLPFRTMAGFPECHTIYLRSRAKVASLTLP